jgi:hypothetical protein
MELARSELLNNAYRTREATILAPPVLRKPAPLPSMFESTTKNTNLEDSAFDYDFVDSEVNLGQNLPEFSADEESQRLSDQFAQLFEEALNNERLEFDENETPDSESDTESCISGMLIDLLLALPQSEL